MAAVHAHASQSLAPAYGFTYIKTTDEDRYQIYSPGLHYMRDMRVWNYRLVTSLSVLLPLRGTENGTGYRSGNYYSKYLGTDLFIGFSRDYPVTSGLRVQPALGWHQNGILLRGRAEYMDFYSLTSGLGLNLLTRYGGKDPLFNYAFLCLSYDFFDHLYTDNKLKQGCTLTMGIGHTF